MKTVATGPIDRIMLALLLVAVLTSCAPAATSALNASLGDTAVLSFATSDDTACGEIDTTGLCFDPGDQAALGVEIDIIADTIASLDDACETEEYGATCSLGDVDTPAFVELTGDRVTATATYRREGGARVYQEAAVP